MRKIQSIFITYFELILQNKLTFSAIPFFRDTQKCFFFLHFIFLFKKRTATTKSLFIVFNNKTKQKKESFYNKKTHNVTKIFESIHILNFKLTLFLFLQQQKEL